MDPSNIKPSISQAYSAFINNQDITGAIQKKTSRNSDEGIRLYDAARRSANDLFDMQIRKDDSSSVSVASGINGTPQLTKPDEEQTKSTTGTTTLLALLGQLRLLIGDISISKLQTNLKVYENIQQGHQQQYSELSDALAIAQQEADNALLESEYAGDAYNQAQEEYAAVQKKVNDAEMKLYSLDPNDPEYMQAKSELDAALVEREQVKNNLDKAQQNYENALSISSEKIKYSEELLEQIKMIPPNQTPNIDKQSQKNLSALAALTLLMAKFVNLLGENAEKKLKNDLQTFQAMQAGRQKEMERKSEEFEQEVRKAEQMQKTMGCIAKILGPLLTLVGVVAAAFTGGASLAIAAIGVALLTADTISMAINGTSITSMILNPIIEKVFVPLMKMVQKILDVMLDKTPLGLLLKALDKATGMDITSMVSSAMAAMTAMAIMIGVAYVAKSIGKEIIKKLAPMIERMLGQTIMKIASKIGEKVAVKSSSVAAQRAAGTTQQVVAVANTAHITSQAVGSIHIAKLEEKALAALADFKLAQTQLKILNSMIESAVDNYSSANVMMQKMMSNLSQTITEQQNTGTTILRRTYA